MSEGHFAKAERERLERELDQMRREAHAARPLVASYGGDLAKIARVLRAAGIEGESAVGLAEEAAKRLSFCRHCGGEL